MPIEVKAFACSFCPRKTRLRLGRKSLLGHERTCFWNPERRACATCRHFSHEREEDYEFFDGKSIAHPYRVNCCERELIEYSKENRNGVLRHDCPEWEAKETTPDGQR